ncbi:MAG: tRNA pseudouridine(54/55) synthase Pus10 [Candidatus Aenigmatarchaeota archaeon]
MGLLEKITDVLKGEYVCDSCLGRQCAELLSGFSNTERGRILRVYTAMLVDAGENLDVGASNLYGFKFRNTKFHAVKPNKCKICKNFFSERVEELAKAIAKKTAGYEFKTFLIGTVVSAEMAKAEEDAWHSTGVEFVEPIKNEINREVGKAFEKITHMKFDLKEPDIVAIIDLGQDKISLQVKSIYVYGRYQKLVRGIPQTKWLCRECKGKGCPRCKGKGKMYETSVHENIEPPLLKAAKAKASKMHGSGREDIDVRCLGWRPFILELVRPMVRNLDLRKLQAQVNKSRKVKVRGLKIAGKRDVEDVKSSRHDKTYMAEVVFEKKIDVSKLKLVKALAGKGVDQRTPRRVAHRRADLVRRRGLKRISVRRLGPRKLEMKLTGEAGIYVKELITGDEGRTSPSVAELLGNKVKSIKLDVIKIHVKRGKI